MGKEVYLKTCSGAKRHLGVGRRVSFRIRVVAVGVRRTDAVTVEALAEGRVLQVSEEFEARTAGRKRVLESALQHHGSSDVVVKRLTQ